MVGGREKRRRSSSNRVRVIEVETGKTDSQGRPEVLLLATDRLDLEAELVALGYRFRWAVELFFRWFKCILGRRHLLAESQKGVTHSSVCGDDRQPVAEPVGGQEADETHLRDVLFVLQRLGNGRGIDGPPAESQGPGRQFLVARIEPNSIGLAIRYGTQIRETQMNAVERAVGSLTPLPVMVDGQWLSPPERDWQGQITAEEPVVAVLFLVVGTACYWTRSERRGQSQVDLVLFPYDKAGCDVQVNYSVSGGNRRCRTRVPSATYVPVLPPHHEFRCGSVQSFARVEGNPTVDLLILFLARRDVRSARCGLWHLRKGSLDSILDESLRRILTYGRRGRLNRAGRDFLSF